MRVRSSGRYPARASRRAGKESFPYAGAALTCGSGEEPVSGFAARAKAAWARLIRKVHEADPLECPKCKGPMRVIALIEESETIRRILEHLGRWAPEPAGHV